MSHWRKIVALKRKWRLLARVLPPVPPVKTVNTASIAVKRVGVVGCVNESNCRSDSVINCSLVYIESYIDSFLPIKKTG